MAMENSRRGGFGGGRSAGGEHGAGHIVSKLSGECLCFLLQISGYLGGGYSEKWPPPPLLFLKFPKDSCPSLQWMF